MLEKFNHALLALGIVLTLVLCLQILRDGHGSELLWAVDILVCLLYSALLRVEMWRLRRLRLQELARREAIFATFSNHHRPPP